MKPFRRAFITAFLLFSAGACSSLVSVSDRPNADVDPSSSAEPPDEPCPAEWPTEGCATEGLECTYFESGCHHDVSTTLICADGEWVYDNEDISEGSDACGPPCPSGEPEAGSACPHDPASEEGYPQDCAWSTTTSCGDDVVYGWCGEDASGDVVWQLELGTGCGSSGCAGYETSDDCSLDWACQWLTPGCAGAGNDVTAGCYARVSCGGNANACGDWGTCSTVGYDPCPGGDCGSCAADLDVCLPNTAP